VVWRAVIFDLYQTLLRGGTAAQRRQVNDEMARALGVDPTRLAALFDQTSTERMRGDFGSVPATLKELAHRIGGAPDEGAIRLATLAWQRFHQKTVWPPASTLSTLDHLREHGLLLGVMSNCSEETVIQWPSQPLAQRFDAAVFSCEVHAVKPDPAIYHALLAKLGVEPAECVYVGDGANSELRTAQTLGMRAIRTLEFAYNDPKWTGESIAKLSELIGRLA
jgi:putative hydrolase of the HAD superfamily